MEKDPKVADAAGDAEAEGKSLKKHILIRKRN